MICACLCQSTVHFTCSLHPVLPAQTLICPLYVLICPFYVPYMSLICPLYVLPAQTLAARGPAFKLDIGPWYQKRPTLSKETYSVKRDLLSQKRPTQSKETYSGRPSGIVDGALRVAKVGDRRHYGQNYHLRVVHVPSIDGSFAQ